MSPRLCLCVLAISCLMPLTGCMIVRIPVDMVAPLVHNQPTIATGTVVDEQGQTLTGVKIKVTFDEAYWTPEYLKCLFEGGEAGAYVICGVGGGEETRTHAVNQVDTGRFFIKQFADHRQVKTLTLDFQKDGYDPVTVGIGPKGNAWLEPTKGDSSRNPVPMAGTARDLHVELIKRAEATR